MILKEQSHVRFIYSEKTTNFCEISTLVLSYVVPVKSKVEILQNYVAFSDYMNFTYNYYIAVDSRHHLYIGGRSQITLAHWVG